MTREVIKSVLKTKLLLMDYSISFLPEEIQTHLNGLKQDFIKAVNEVTGEYVNTTPEKKKEKTIKPISID